MILFLTFGYLNTVNKVCFFLVNGALDPASLKHLQALDPTNPANADLATCKLAEQELSKGILIEVRNCTLFNYLMGCDWFQVDT